MSTKTTKDQTLGYLDMLQLAINELHLQEAYDRALSLTDEEIAQELKRHTRLAGQEDAIRNAIMQGRTRQSFVASAELVSGFFSLPALAGWLDQLCAGFLIARVPAAATADTEMPLHRRRFEGGWLRLEHSEAAPNIWYVILEFDQLVDWTDASLCISSRDMNCLAFLKFRASPNRRIAQSELSTASQDHELLLRALSSPGTSATISVLPRD